MTPSPGWISISNFFLSFYLLYFVLSPFEENGLPFWVPGVLPSVQKLFCGSCSAFKWSFDEFMGEKVVCLSYSSAIIGLPPLFFLQCGNLFFFPPISHRRLNLTLVFLLCSIYVLSIFVLVSHCLINVWLVCIYNGTSHLFFFSHLRNVFDELYIMCDICHSFLKLTGYCPGFSLIS